MATIVYKKKRTFTAPTETAPNIPSKAAPKHPDHQKPLRKPHPEPTGNGYKQVIVIRTDLGLRKGIKIAQGAKASLGLLLSRTKKVGDNLVIDLSDPRMQAWIEGDCKILTVKAQTETEILEMYGHAINKNVPSYLIEESAFENFNGVSHYTALVVGPDTEERVNAVTGKASLL